MNASIVEYRYTPTGNVWRHLFVWKDEVITPALAKTVDRVHRLSRRYDMTPNNTAYDWAKTFSAVCALCHVISVDTPPNPAWRPFGS
jgi:hypothetical protein